MAVSRVGTRSGGAHVETELRPPRGRSTSSLRSTRRDLHRADAKSEHAHRGQLQKIVSGPTQPPATVTREVRKAFHEVYRRLSAHSTWMALSPGGELVARRGAPKRVSRALLDEFDAALGDLILDPAKGKASDGSIEEAAVGLSARAAGIIDGAIRRDGTGLAEFVGDDQRLWDVKSPRSPGPQDDWFIDPQHQVERIRHDLSQGNLVLLNLSGCNSTDAQGILRALGSALSAAELAQIYVLANR